MRSRAQAICDALISPPQPPLSPGTSGRNANAPSAQPNFSDPTRAPGEGWEWRGNGPPSSGQGNWHNPRTGESLHPDLGHSDPIGPHYDYKDPSGTSYRVFPDGRVVPK
ncbi:MAG: hypothetical protein LC808_42340 [Actinobacteria bacterium]|nr:hypothetical protein [Actinomycetota bacterium]